MDAISRELQKLRIVTFIVFSRKYKKNIVSFKHGFSVSINGLNFKLCTCGACGARSVVIYFFFNLLYFFQKNTQNSIQMQILVLPAYNPAAVLRTTAGYDIVTLLDNTYQKENFQSNADCHSLFYLFQLHALLTLICLWVA